MCPKLFNPLCSKVLIKAKAMLWNTRIENLPSRRRCGQSCSSTSHTWVHSTCWIRIARLTCTSQNPLLHSCHLRVTSTQSLTPLHTVTVFHFHRCYQMRTAQLVHAPQQHPRGRIHPGYTPKPSSSRAAFNSWGFLYPSSTLTPETWTQGSSLLAFRHQVELFFWRAGHSKEQLFHLNEGFWGASLSVQ